MEIFKRIYFIAGIVFFAILGILYIVIPQNDFSEMENRVLTNWEAPSVDSVISGDFQETVDKASQDQFFLRDQCVAATVFLQRLMGKKDVNGVYFGKDHMYIEKIKDSDIPISKFGTLLGVCDRIADTSGVSTTVLLAPSPGSIYKENLPAYAKLFDEEAYEAFADENLAKAKRLSIREELLAGKKDARVYFATDHHWSAYGAYIGAKKYLESRGVEIADISEFELTEASDSFLGTLYSKAPLSDAAFDTINLVERKQDITVSYEGNQYDSIYQMDKLDTKDKYAVYFGGNYDSVTIINNEASSEMGHICIVKDSFANSLVPYLIPYYRQIDMVDARYYNGSFTGYLSSEKPDEVLICYELSNFIRDGNIIKLMR